MTDQVCKMRECKECVEKWKNDLSILHGAFNDPRIFLLSMSLYVFLMEEDHSIHVYWTELNILCNLSSNTKSTDNLK